MKNNYLRYILMIVLTGCFSNLFAQYPAGSPVAKNGKLSVSGASMVNECGTAVQLKGMSTHGLQWFENCLTSASLDALVKDWKIDILRLAMYPDEDGSGYVYNREKWKSYIDNMVDECQKRGIYCMIDWHVLTPGNPNDLLSEATEFWTYMSKAHAGKDHVIYEIANEPNGVNWSQVKFYAEKIIPVIRGNDESTIIIVGTPEWSQLVDEAAKDKLAGSNIMYALHFYAVSHRQELRDKANTAIAAGLPIFVTEFGTSRANGTDAIDLAETAVWMQWMTQNKVSWLNWSFADKDEVAAALKPGVCSTQGWNETTESGTYIKSQLGSTFAECSSVGNVVPPTITITSPAKDTSISVGSTLEITATVTGTATSVAFYDGNTLLETDASAPYTYTLSGAETGKFSIKARAIVSEGVYGISNVVSVFVNEEQAPFGGTAKTIAATKVKIEAEDFDEGGNMNAYYDVTEGNDATNTYREGEDVDLEGSGMVNVGYTKAGEWLEYTLLFEGTAEHTFTLNVASQPGGTLRVLVDGIDVSGPITVSPGSWSQWTPVTVESKTPIAYGERVVRIEFTSGDVNLDNFEVERTGTVTGIHSSSKSYATSGILFPNPSTSTFTFKASENIKNLSVVNIYGIQVNTQENITAGQNLEFGSDLQAGTYTMQITKISGEVEVIKMMKVK